MNPQHDDCEVNGVDFSALYDAHPDYVARRDGGSIAEALVNLEVRLFKLPGLMSVLPQGTRLRSAVEIGCATGELIATLPVELGGRRVGLDISPANVAAARKRFPAVEFHCGDFHDAGLSGFDAVVMSDVLEHVPDDEGFLRDAARLGSLVLVNLPLEDNWLNDRRAYGTNDVSGHLRRYSLAQGLALVERAGLEMVSYKQVWMHETPTETARRELLREHTGVAYSGRWPVARLKQLMFATATAVRPFGRRLFASKLLAAARRPSER